MSEQDRAGEDSAQTSHATVDRRGVDVAAPGGGQSSGGFWQSGEGIYALDDPTPFGQENALQKLGKPPFEKTARGRFRLLGYLATVYEHVSQDVRRAAADSAKPQEWR